MGDPKLPKPTLDLDEREQVWQVRHTVLVVVLYAGIIASFVVSAWRAFR